MSRPWGQADRVAQAYWRARQTAQRYERVQKQADERADRILQTQLDSGVRAATVKHKLQASHPGAGWCPHAARKRVTGRVFGFFFKPDSVYEQDCFFTLFSYFE